jgi:hypothetical protein
MRGDAELLIIFHSQPTDLGLYFTENLLCSLYVYEVRSPRFVQLVSLS